MIARDDDKIYVFINCSHKDGIIAEVIEDQLKQLTAKWRGRYALDCFVDYKIMPGQEWHGVIVDRLRFADWLIVILTGEESLYCDFEIAAFIEINGNESGKHRTYNKISCLYDVDDETLPSAVKFREEVTKIAISKNADAQITEDEFWWESPVGTLLREFCAYKEHYSGDYISSQEFRDDIVFAAKKIAEAFRAARSTLPVRDLGSLILKLNPYTNETVPTEDLLDMSEIYPQLEDEYQREWTFRGQPQVVKKASRIRVRYPITDPDGKVRSYREGYLLIGYQDGDSIVGSMQPHSREEPSERRLNAWINEETPKVNRPFRISINVGAFKPSATASVPFIEPAWSESQLINLVVSLSSINCDVDPSWQEFDLPRYGDSETITFSAVAAAEGIHEFSIRVYLARQMILVQSLAFTVSVEAAEAPAIGAFA
jgi:hypothetical protein